MILASASARFAVIALVVLSLLPSCGLIGHGGLPLPQAAPESVGLRRDGLANLDTIVQASVARQEIAGAVVFVARRGRIAHFAAHGDADREAGLPMSTDALFRIASMTKPVTSAAVLILVDEGKIGLDEPLSRYLPEFAAPTVLPDPAAAGGAIPGRFDRVGPRAAERPVTIRHLLTHTSGLTYGFVGPPELSARYRELRIADGLMETAATTRDNARRLAAAPLAVQPGAAWHYGLSTDVLGAVIEVVTGQDLASFCRERIFAPLGMADTGFSLAATHAGRLAALYHPAEGGGIARTEPGIRQADGITYTATFPFQRPRTYFSGGAGLVSSTADYARFLAMLAGGGELDGVRILSRESTAAMLRNQIGDLEVPFRIHGDKFGFGVGIVSAAARAAGDDVVESAGTWSWAGAFHTYFFVDPEEEIIAILMTQLFPFGHLTLRQDFKKAVYDALAPRLAAAARP